MNNNAVQNPANIIMITHLAGNAVERNHRTLKDLMPEGYEQQQLSDLMTEVCDILNGRCRVGFYESVKREITE
eukprot:7550990-Karenia_brevis.AAC.1